MSKQPGRQRSCRSLAIRAPEADSLQHELWQRNHESSPLLRLPPEIRNRIYVLALTYGQINIQYRPWVHRCRQKNGARYKEVIPGGFWTQVYRAGADPWAEASLGKRAALTLLSGVCRQLYVETALLPFRLNQWSFGNKYVMDRFVLKEKRLSLPQRRAIRTLWAVQGQLTKAMEKYLGGLEVIIWKRGKSVRKEVLSIDSDLALRRSGVLGRDREWYFYD